MQTKRPTEENVTHEETINQLYEKIDALITRCNRQLDVLNKHQERIADLEAQLAQRGTKGIDWD